MEVSVVMVQPDLVLIYVLFLDVNIVFTLHNYYSVDVNSIVLVFVM